MKRRLAVVITLIGLVILGGAASALAKGAITHVVRRGETLSSIAQEFHVTVRAIALANGIANPNLIFVGQVLTIPTTPTTHTVAAGDTLAAIARRFGTTVTALVELNHLTNPDRLAVGQVLEVPTEAQSATPTPTPTQPTAMGNQATTTTYVVQPGDILSRIAVRFKTSVQKIALLNHLTNPNLIFVGEKLIIQQGNVTPTPTPTQ